MAELVGGAFLSATLQAVFERLASRDIKDYFRGRKLKGDLLKKLQITLISINQVLEDAEEMQYRNSNVKLWLDELKDAVFKAEDLLDEIATKASRQKLEAELHGTTRKVRNFLTTFVNPFDIKIQSRIQEVLENLEFLAKQKEELRLKKGSGVGVGRQLSKRLPTTSLIDESTMYGRDVDKEEIIQILLSHNMNGNQITGNVISIMGMGGMGKTTLAQLVYNDKRIVDQFQLKAWVCISEEFDVVRITKVILEALHFSTKDSNDLNLLQLELKEKLTGKKFLIVLDDVWNEHHASWETLQAPFTYGALGSKILVTTRNKKVASVMDSAHIHPLKQLAEEDCWMLFTKHAFNGQHGSTDPYLVSIGRKIVKKCGGLPLAIKTLGSLLHTELSHQEWINILESDIWRLSENDSNIIPALKLSYHYLPSNLKLCFAYCSIFPKDYCIEKDFLIQLWMAEGLLDSCKKDQRIEEVGNKFFSELESRSFFERRYVNVNDVELWSFFTRRRHNNDGYFIMHDLLNDLAKYVMGEFCFHLEGSWEQANLSKVRNISNMSGECLDFELISKCNQLHNFMQFGDIRDDVVHDLFSRLACLKHMRVLSLPNCQGSANDGNKLGGYICNLKHLRYLNLSFTAIKELPNSFCLLINLQTLKLAHCLFLTELPPDFHKLINLRRLYLQDSGLKKMPKYMGKLKHLHTLDAFILGRHKRLDMEELGELKHLRGQFSILKLENIIDPMDSKKANMKDKKHLKTLRLQWSKNSENPQREMCVLEFLQPNSNLQELRLSGYNGTEFSNWFGASYLPNLVYLGMYGNQYCSSLPPLGQLPSLKDLHICDYNGIKVIGPEFFGNNSSSVPFRSLELLNFRCMEQWEEWKICSEGESFPHLQCLKICYCGKLRKSLPQHLPSLKQLLIEGCENLEFALPNASAVTHLLSRGCKKIWLEDVPTSLTWVEIESGGVDESFLNNILLNSPYLEKLMLNGPNEIASISMGGIEFSLSKLTSISFEFMRNLKSLPENMHALFPSLHSLELSCCPELESLPEGGLPSSLANLIIAQCPKLVASRKDWGLHKLHSLQKFEYSGKLDNGQSFPEEGLLPANLTSLRIECCSNLKSLNYKGLLHLQSLETIAFASCPRLSFQDLPEEGLPRSLSRLIISVDCPLLAKGCEKEKGQDWPKISHIPTVEINYSFQCEDTWLQRYH